MPELRAQVPPALAGGVCLIAAGALAAWLPPLARTGLAALPAVRLDVWGPVLAGALLQVVLAAGGGYVLEAALVRWVTHLRQDSFARMLNAPQHFHDTSWSANLISVWTTDMTLVQEGLAQVLPTLARHLPAALLALAWMGWHNPLLTAGLALAALPGGLLLLLAGERIRRWTLQGQQQLGRTAIAVQESLQGARSIKSLAQEPFFEQRIGGLTGTLLQVRLRRLAWTILIIGGLPAAEGLCLAVGLVIAYGQWQSGQAGWTDLLTFAAMAAILAGSADRLVQAATQLGGLFGAGERVAELYADLPPAPARPAAAEARTARFAGHVSFEGVTFAYPAGGRGVFDISFQLRPGEVAWLTGPNGAGKSTLIHLLLRLYAPDAGRICLDDCPADAAPVADWRRSMAVVGRDPAVFSLSAAENIALGRPGASRSEIEAAARQAQAHEFIQALPGGYSAALGEGGLRLSSGQRQRLALARLFLQDPAIVILDEAFTSLDHGSGQALGQALAPWLGTRTFLLVSHQPLPEALQSHWHPTRILRLEAGRLIPGPAG